MVLRGGGRKPSWEGGRDEWGAGKTKKKDVKPACFREGFQQARPLVFPHVLGDGITERVQDAAPAPEVIGGREEIALVGVTAKARVNPVVVAVVSLYRHGPKVIAG